MNWTKLWMGVLAVLLVLTQLQLWQELAQVRALNARLTEQVEANEALEARNDALFAEVQDLREGLDAIEERARSELGLVGEDESFYLIVDPDVAESLPQLEDPPTSSNEDPPNATAAGEPPPNGG